MPKTLKIHQKKRRTRIVPHIEDKWTIFPLKGEKHRIQPRKKIERIPRKTLTRKRKTKKKTPIVPAISQVRKIERKKSERKEAEKQQKTVPMPPTILKKRGKITIRSTNVRILNQELIDLLGKLEVLMIRSGQPFRARAYHNAQESIMLYQKPITDVKQLKGQKAIGSTILKKFGEYVETGTLRVLERAKGNPALLFARIYGIGPKKARKLVEQDKITTLDELRERAPAVLNKVQQQGLKYFEAIEERIPRSEIDAFKKALEPVFAALEPKGSRFEIVGSYRRGAKSSGDIDIIITNNQNDRSIFTNFIEALKKKKILMEILSKGRTKSLTIGRLSDGSTPRRIDFMYSTPSEWAFSILYFTGSKPFNVVMRQRAIDLGYTMNEHNFFKLVGKKKGPPLDLLLKTERDIFDFLGLVYKRPNERVGGRAVVLKGTDEPMEELGIIPEKKPRKITLKRRKKVKIKRNTTIKKRPSKVAHHDAREHLVALASGGVSTLTQLNENQLAEMLRLASATYYHKKPLVTDEVFDILQEYVEAEYPDNLQLQEIGAPVDKDKVALPYFLASMRKIKPDTGRLQKWKVKHPGPDLVSGKLDGISALYTTEGPTPALYTRGQATTGMNISHLIPYLQLPKEKGIAIRGELVIPQKLFQETWATRGYKSARNFVSGQARPWTLDSKSGPDKWKDIDFVGYEVIKPVLKPSQQMKWLEDHGTITVIHKEEENITNAGLSALLVDWRSNYRYEVDGVVVINDKIYPRKDENPRHAFAFKMVLSDQKAEVKVLDVLWTPSKDGYLKPVVRVEKVRIKGADIEFATAYNARFVKDNGIGIGAVILLIRSGDVIPKIEKVIKRAPHPKMPDVPWKWNTTKADAILLDKRTSKLVKERNIEYFFTKIKTDGLGPGNIRKILAQGFDSVSKILRMSIDDLLTVKGFKEKTAKRIHDSIRHQIKTIGVPRLAAATNAFARGLGRRRLQLLLNRYPDILYAEMDDADREALVLTVPGFAKKTARAFVKARPDFIRFMQDTGLEWKLRERPVLAAISSGHPLAGKKITLTGFPKTQLAETLRNLGVDVTSTVSKNTNLVIVKDLEDDTGKAERARELGIPLMTVDVLKSRYNIK